MDSAIKKIIQVDPSFCKPEGDEPETCPTCMHGNFSLSNGMWCLNQQRINSLETAGVTIDNEGRVKSLYTYTCILHRKRKNPKKEANSSLLLRLATLPYFYVWIGPAIAFAIIFFLYIVKK